MKNFTLFFLLAMTFGFSQHATAQSPAKLTTKAVPAKTSLEDRIALAEKKLETMQADPAKYSAERITSVENKLNQLKAMRAEKQVNGQYPEPKPETPWVEVSRAELENLPEGTQKRVKVVFNKQTRERSQRYYIRSNN